MTATSHRPRRPRRQRGFTLVEVIVVLAVVLLLTGIAVPMISGYMEDGRRARAEAEIKVIAGAVTSLYKDVGTWPARDATGAENQLYMLCSGAAVPSTNPFGASHSWITWLMDGTHGDTLDNHLLLNTPGGATAGAYPTTGSVRWRGPYSAGGVSVDPWGNPYLVTVISGWYVHATRYKRMVVLSAGPDAIINTSYELTSTTELAGDDIGVIIHQKN